VGSDSISPRCNRSIPLVGVGVGSSAIATRLTRRAGTIKPFNMHLEGRFASIIHSTFSDSVLVNRG
jgi:hypothetical protein